MKSLKRIGVWLSKIKPKFGMFGSVFGASFAIIVLMVMLGTPATAHASVWSWLGGLVSKVGDATLGAIFMGISYIILSFTNLILYIVGTLFNTVIARTVFGFAAFLGGNAGIIAGWKVIRDVCNIALLFGFIFLGIATIINIQSYEVKKTLPRLVIFAILLNFSLLASQAVIDTSNIFASVLANQAGTTCTATGADSIKTCVNDGIAGKIIAASGMSTILSDQSGTGSKTDDASNTTWGIIYLGMSIFVIITAVVLLAGTVLLIIRAVVLAFLMVLSPIGFAGLAIPPLEKYAKKWWDALLAQSFFAPVYLLLIFIGLKIENTITGGTINGSLASALAGNASGIDIVLIFALMTGFMIFALVAAKNMGAMGASIATKFAGGAVMGGAAFVGRRTVGRGLNAAARGVRNSAWAERNPNLARWAAGTFDKGAKSSFDARATKAIGAAGVDLGKPGKTAAGGYRAIEEKATKERVDFAKSLMAKRPETDEEWAKRKEKALEDLNAASSNQQNATNAAQKQRQIALQMESLARQNPDDATLADKLAKAREVLTAREKEVADADKELAVATTAQANVMANRGEVEGPQRQKNFAANLEKTWTIPLMPRHGATAARQANAAAVASIKKYAGMTPDERALATIAETLKKNSGKEAGDTPSPAPKPAEKH